MQKLSRSRAESHKMLIRVQSPDGTKRIECNNSDNTSDFIKKVKDAFCLPSVRSFDLYKRGNKTDLISSDKKFLKHFEFRHGDLIYLVKNISEMPDTSKDNGISTTGLSVSSTLIGPEDEVDEILFNKDGYIYRERDEKLCNHGGNAKCLNCAPLEPYNEDYLREQNIKHMSFHCYLRKLTGGVDKGKFAALENISCKLKSGCKEHMPWPHGICTKCQPNAITLNRQGYRHVDNVVFENPDLVDRFLNYWRYTGHQRLGILYGKYEVHKDVPLGIKAIVLAIYEPPQDGTKDSLKLLPDEHAAKADEIASKLGLKKVGWIFTDLIAEDLQTGSVKHLRNGKSYFLSAQECVMAGYFQNLHPNPCRLSPDGYFGSKFVTICVTGDKDNHIHMEGYQVSNQCMALVKDNCLVPTKDAPELGYVKESSNEQYVPDVFYKEKDSYGNDITQLARPLPIEYLLVDVPVSSPVTPKHTFYSDQAKKPFPVENRLLDGHIQDFNALKTYLHQFLPDMYPEALTDFHVLLYLGTSDSLPLKEIMDPLLDAIRNENRNLISQWCSSNTSWSTVLQMMEALPSMSQRDMGQSTSSSSSSSMWTCDHCTYLNSPGTNVCEICRLPPK